MPERLRGAGLTLTAYHETSLPDDADDNEWFKLCGQNGWIGLTKDRKLARRDIQIAQIIGARAVVYFLRNASLVGQDAAELIITASRKIRRIAIAGTPKAPLIGRIGAFGGVVITNKPSRRSKGAH